MKERNQAIEDDRVNKRREVPETNETGKLTMEADDRGKGVGAV